MQAQVHRSLMRFFFEAGQVQACNNTACYERKRWDSQPLHNQMYKHYHTGPAW